MMTVAGDMADRNNERIAYTLAAIRSRQAMSGERSPSGSAPTVRWGLKLPNCGGVLCQPEWARPDTILSIAQEAEQAGFDSVWLHDHLVTPSELKHVTPDFYEPLVTMTALAAARPGLTVGVATIILPLRDPVLLAKQVQTAAAFFPGRMMIGLGAGRYRSEFESLGLDYYERRGSVAAEYLSIMRALMTQEVVDHVGDMRTLTAASMNPRPTPRTPLLYAGNVAAGARRAAKLADGWIGASMPARDMASMVNMMSDVRREAGRADDPFLVTYSATIEREASRNAMPSPDGRPDLHMHAATISGDTRSVAAQLSDYVIAGAEHFQLSLRATSLGELSENIGWFTGQVLPAVGDAVSAARS
jgi:alkanesulfonate monooxygenase SsuD/methylene tetrahydromethanopterin reductase-like flavin-dependent oxidoreductase (luciferase family)